MSSKRFSCCVFFPHVSVVWKFFPPRVLWALYTRSLGSTGITALLSFQGLCTGAPLSMDLLGATEGAHSVRADFKSLVSDPQQHCLCKTMKKAIKNGRCICPSFGCWDLASWGASCWKVRPQDLLPMCKSERQKSKLQLLVQLLSLWLRFIIFRN